MPPAAPPSRLSAHAALAGGAALAVVVAAGLARRPDAVQPAPPASAARAPEPWADFLVAAGDSTYWVTRPADARGDGSAPVRVRASALFLARWGGRLSEVYVADDERAFDDGAWFASQRVFRRDLLTGDSALVFADPAVPRLAARYAAAHPEARVLDPDESPPSLDDEADDHALPPAAETVVTLAGAHGPYVSLEQRTTGVAGDAPAGDAVIRRVVDLRSGAEASLAGLFGAPVAEVLAGHGRAALAAARTHAGARLRRAAGAAADTADAGAARRALAALGTLRFDAANFGLAEVDGGPAVTFVALGRDVDAAPVTLALAPIAVPGAAPAWWRAEVAPALLRAPAEAEGGPRAARWRPARGAYEVRARRTADATALELVAGPGAAAGAEPGGAGRAWPLARVPAGSAQLFPVDDGATRRALRRAFDESAFYDDAITSVAWRRAPRPAAPSAAGGRAARRAS